ncbi:chromate transporter [Candidatus Bipolaricaulota bacterium]|nr:chromate transporter [Candidatus Bipolaricaulota bacterium]
MTGLDHILAELFGAFVRIGFGAFGGGMPAIQLLSHEVVEVHRWLSPAEMAEVVALAEMTPGPIAVNAATFTGYRVAGIAGAALATFSVLLPAIFFLSVFLVLRRFSRSDRWARKLASALQPGILALIAAAVWSLGKAVIHGWIFGLFAAASFFSLLLSKEKVHPALLILLFGLLGLAIS